MSNLEQREDEVNLVEEHVVRHVEAYVEEVIELIDSVEHR